MWWGGGTSVWFRLWIDVVWQLFILSFNNDQYNNTVKCSHSAGDARVFRRCPKKQWSSFRCLGWCGVVWEERQIIGKNYSICLTFIITPPLAIFQF